MGKCTYVGCTFAHGIKDLVFQRNKYTPNYKNENSNYIPAKKSLKPYDKDLSFKPEAEPQATPSLEDSSEKTEPIKSVQHDETEEEKLVKEEEYNEEQDDYYDE